MTSDAPASESVVPLSEGLNALTFRLWPFLSAQEDTLISLYILFPSTVLYLHSVFLDQRAGHGAIMRRHGNDLNTIISLFSYWLLCSNFLFFVVLNRSFLWNSTKSELTRSRHTFLLFLLTQSLVTHSRPTSTSTTNQHNDIFRLVMVYCSEDSRRQARGTG